MISPTGFVHITTNAVLSRGVEEKGEYKKGERIRVCRMSLPLQGPAVTYSPTLPGSTIGAGGTPPLSPPVCRRGPNPVRYVPGKDSRQKLSTPRKVSGY